MGEIVRNQKKENKMKVSRRQFFKGLGRLIVASDLSHFKPIDPVLTRSPPTPSNMAFPIENRERL